MLSKYTIVSALATAASAGTILWDGRFNDMTSSADLSKWSFSNPVGSYQYYIHGSGSVDKYVNLDSSFKNPADDSSKQGVKITIDETAKWNGQSMLRTELIPQTSAAINKGTVYYHFSIKTTATNAPTTTNEHQVAFFESHFTELKYGGAAGNKLQWNVGGVSKWDVELKADEWHNVAYEIYFDAGSVTFWHSTGNSPLTKTAGPITASTSSNGADWHLGVLRLPGSNDASGAEDWFFSGVYIESGDLTTAITGPGGVKDNTSPAKSSSALVASSVGSPAATSTIQSLVNTSIPSSSKAPGAPLVSPSTAVPILTVSTTSSKVAPVQTSATSSVSAPSTFVTSVMPVTTSTASVKPQPTSGKGSDTVLPEEFTLKQFIAWLKAKQGIN